MDSGGKRQAGGGGLGEKFPQFPRVGVVDIV